MWPRPNRQSTAVVAWVPAGVRQGGGPHILARGTAPCPSAKSEPD
jgi:hypothetical protein